MIIAIFGGWQIFRWLARNVIEPMMTHFVSYFGPGGTFPHYLKTQEEEAKKQTTMLREMTSAFAEYAADTKRGVDDLVAMHTGAKSPFTATGCEQRLEDLLRCQRIIMKAVKVAAQNPDDPHILEYVAEIDRLASKWVS